MTDRYNAILVTLDKDIRADDAEFILNAIRMIKGVLSVDGNVADAQSHIARLTAEAEIRDKILDIICPRAELR